MRNMLSLLCLVMFLAVAMPAQAQHRADAQRERAPVKLYDQGGNAFSFDRIFSPAHFRMGHSYEMSAGSFGSMGMYTNTMMWQFSSKLAARVDVSYAHAFGGGKFGDMAGFGQDNGRFFLRNAEIAYRPNEHTQFHFSISQSPYGGYYGPYGYYSPYYGGYGHGLRFDARTGDDLFWQGRTR